MTRRIFLNFSRKIPWTLCRLVLFILMLGCFFASMLMDGLTKQVNAQLVGDADLFLSVYTQFDADLAAAQDSEEAKQVIDDYGDMTRTLNPDGNAMYADVPLKARFKANELEISWTIPAEEDEDTDSESQLSYREKIWLERAKYNTFILTENAVFVDFKTASSLQNQMNAPHAKASAFNESAKAKIRDTINKTRLVTVERPDFLKQHLGVVSLVSGRWMTQEEVDSGAAVCLVPDETGILRPDGFSPIQIGDSLIISFYQYTEEPEKLDDGDFGYRLLGYDSIEMEVIGTYESSALDEQEEILIYIPRTFFVRVLEAQDAFYQENSPAGYPYKAGDAYQNLVSHPLIFQFDSLEHINAFIEDLKETPEYQANEIQYYANIDQTLHMLAGFYGMAGGVSSMLSIFGVIAVAFSIITAVLDVFYRRREIAILQSMGESPGKIITQFTLESLLMLAVSAALAAPAALRLMKGAVPSLFSEGLAETAASANNSFAALSGVIEETSIDSAALIEGLGFASSDYIRIVLLLLLMAACCTAAVWVCTKKFNARNLLND